MAPADDDSSRAYIPPGDIRLTDAVATNGLDAQRNQLASGMEQAFALDPTTGRRREIPCDFWSSDAALGVLQCGRLRIGGRDHVVIVPDTAIAPPISTESEDRLPLPADGPPPAIYISPDHCRITDLIAEAGDVTIQDWLAGGGTAFGLDPDTGERVRIPVEVWHSSAAAKIRATGIWTHTLPRHGSRTRTVDFIVVLPVRSMAPAVDSSAPAPDVAEPPSEQVKLPEQGAARWVAAEARRMKEAGENLSDIRIRKFASELARRMGKAAESDKSISPITAKSIENKLREWALWPTDLIK